MLMKPIIWKACQNDIERVLDFMTDYYKILVVNYDIEKSRLSEQTEHGEGIMTNGET
jgi:hypothetical protein